MTIEVVANGKMWGVAEDADGVTHVVHIDVQHDRYHVIWRCKGHSTTLEYAQGRIRPTGTAITCLTCIARGLP